MRAPPAPPSRPPPRPRATAPAASPRAAAAPPTARPRICRRCRGTAGVPCPGCGGGGTLTPAGYAPGGNPLNVGKVVGTSWTALARTLGRTHFRAAAVRKVPVVVEMSMEAGGGASGGGASGDNAPRPRRHRGLTLVHLISTCDPTVTLWLPTTVLKDRAAWAPGMLLRSDAAARRAAAAGGSGGGGDCRRCGGGGSVPCPLCAAAGEVVEVE